MVDVRRRARNAPIPTPAVRLYDRTIRGKRAWTRETIRQEDWLLPIPEACLGPVASLEPGIKLAVEIHVLGP